MSKHQLRLNFKELQDVQKRLQSHKLTLSGILKDIEIASCNYSEGIKWFENQSLELKIVNKDGSLGSFKV